jgi:hypothetical protein
MFRTSILVALSLALSLNGFSRQVKGGAYSKAATPLWDLFGDRESGYSPVVVVSPDHRSRVTARLLEHGCKDDDECVVLNVSGAFGDLRLDIGPGVGSELLWAPDSKAFFFTTSDSGRNGFYRLFVVDSFDGKIQRREITNRIYEEFGHPFRCDSGLQEPPNVGGIGWVGRTHHIWVAAEVVDHSVCDSAGTFKAYEIDPASMTILRTLDQIEAKRILGPLLGWEIRHAPNVCIRKPEKCYLSGNHPELNPH